MIFLRRATEEDCDLIYKWANDIEVRQNAFNSNFIPYDEHCRWYKSSLDSINRIIYIATDGNREIGQIRLDKEENKSIISYSVNKSYRGRGYGKALIKLIKEEALKNDIIVLEGLVKKDNIPSQRAFISNKFIEYKEDRYFRYVFFLKEG